MISYGSDGNKETYRMAEEKGFLFKNVLPFVYVYVACWLGFSDVFTRQRPHSKEVLNVNP
jgi:hypothetical protein